MHFLCSKNPCSFLKQNIVNKDPHYLKKINLAHIYESTDSTRNYNKQQIKYINIDNLGA